MRVPAVPALCIVVALAACAGPGGEIPAASTAEDPAAEDPADAAGPVAPGEDALRALRAGFGLPRVTAFNVVLSRAMLVEAVYQATALSGAGAYGQATFTGTLQPGYGGALQYVPQPTDRLVVRLPEQTHEFVVGQAQGDPQAATAAAWLNAPHVLRYRHAISGQADAEVAVQYDGARFQVEVRGWTVQSGARYDVDLVASGGAGGERDFHGQDVASRYHLGGTVRGGGVEIAVDETHASSLVAADSVKFLLPSQRGSASTFEASIGNVVRVGGAEYRFDDVRVRTEQSTRGGNARGGMTLLTGRVLRDGAAYGECLLAEGRAYLRTAAGTFPLDEAVPGAAN